jgi:hypothetical protein
MEQESVPDHGPSTLYWPKLVTQASEGPEHTKAVMCRTEKHKYVSRLYEKDELYDLVVDPQEMHNLIDDPEYVGILTALCLIFYPEYLCSKVWSIFMLSRNKDRIAILLITMTVFLVACNSRGTVKDSEEISNLPFPGGIPTEVPIRSQTPSRLPPPSLRFERISTEDGLSNSIVTCILQDVKGYMWFGTQDGLNRYDGISFLIYRHDPEDPGSLQDDFIESIYEDREGVLWVGTQDGWLEKFDPATGSFAHYDLGARVLSIFEDSAGRFWVGTLEPGLILFERESGESSRVWSKREVSSIAEDQNGGIWVVSSESGIGKYDQDIHQTVDVDLEYQVHKVYMDSKGYLWLSTWGGGLGLLDPALTRPSHPQREIFSARPT